MLVCTGCSENSGEVNMNCVSISYSQHNVHFPNASYNCYSLGLTRE